MLLDIPMEHQTPFFEAIRYGAFNATWVGEDLVLTPTELGNKLLVATLAEGATVPDDPIALQANAEMWKERALKAEARVKAVERNLLDMSTSVLNITFPRVHGPGCHGFNHCTEYKDEYGRLRGECLDVEAEEDDE